MRGERSEIINRATSELKMRGCLSDEMKRVENP